MVAHADQSHQNFCSVISMYRAQILELRRQFSQQFGSDVTQTVDFNTVDGFQGQEKDIIILSCVRAGPGLESIGFLSDVRRINVALTRSKSSLFILGNAPTLSRSNEIWSTIISDARSRASLVEADAMYFSAPAAQARRSPSPTKSQAQVPAAILPPTDLTTPRELKAAIDRRNSGSVSRFPQERPPHPSTLLPDAPPPLKSDGESLKRKFEAEDLDLTSTKVRKGSNRGKLPRPKDTKASLFIPKKKTTG
ncbi:AAA domain-containing protein [Mycena sp. CBHHK59/15]|nr:AAA domain-containing protein [Mycena sp. CBHHK59/15]